MTQRNELNRRFALYHDDPNIPEGIPYEQHLLHTYYTLEFHASVPLLAVCDPRYVTGPRGHINKRANLFQCNLEESGARRPPENDNTEGSQAEEDEEEEGTKVPAAWQRGQRPEQLPRSARCEVPPVRDIDRGVPLETVFRNLDLDDSDSPVMFFHHVYMRWEAEDPNRRGFTRFTRTRVTANMQLPGVTSKDQLDIRVVPPGDQVLVVYRLNPEWLNSNQTTGQVGIGGNGQGGFNSNQSLLSSRVTSHQESINDLIVEHDGSVEINTLINLPRRCESQFTTRDDFGNEGAREGTTNGVYDQAYQIPKFPTQVFSILHIQFVVKKDIISHSERPTGLVICTNLAQQFQQ